jgi:Ca2+-binding EF-hand superfamily protein
MSLVNPEQVFRYLDTNNSGYITKNDLKQALRYLGIIKTQNDFMFLLRNVSESIDLNEYMKIVNNELNNTISREQLIQAFEVFDSKKTGKCSAKDLFHCLKVIGEKLSESDIEKMKRMVEVGHDGQVNYIKLVDFLLKR